MKANQQLRQNKKVVKHRVNKYKFHVPEHLKAGQRVLGGLLPEVPGIPKVIGEILKEFNFPVTKPNEVLRDYLSAEEQSRIDWLIVRKKLEEKLRRLTNFLPKELTVFQKMVEYKESLPKKARFTEPATHKLKIDVRKLYKAFKQIYVFTTDNLALPWKKAADNFYAEAADNLSEFLKTGIAAEVPNDWVNAVQAVHVFGEQVVVAMANELSDPEEVVEMFREEYVKTFKRRRSIFTKTDAFLIDYIRKRLDGTAYKNLAGDFIQENNLEFDSESDDDIVARAQLEDAFKHDIRNFLKRLDGFAGEKI